MVKYAWIFGRVALLVEYFEQIGPDEIEGGARVEVRRVERELVPGSAAAVSGFRVLPVTEGVWRADLFHLLNRPGDQPIYHYHPNFENGDVGERSFDGALTADHLGWAYDQVANLRDGILRDHAPDLVDDVDPDDLATILPQVRAALEHADRFRESHGRRLLTADGEARARAERLANPV
jgi:hypothetical protein